MKLQLCAGKGNGAIRLLGTATTRGVAKAANFALIASVFSMAAIGSLITNSSHGTTVTVTYTFPNGSPFDAGGSGTQTLDGLTLSTVSASAPEYAFSGTTGTWTGGFVPATTNIVGSNGLGIDNPNVLNNDSQINQEQQNINPGESWTFSLNLPVMFKQIGFTSLGSGDFAEVVVGALDSATFTNTSSVTDPFADLVIPAGTNITFTNTNQIPTGFQIALSGSANLIWRLTGLTFETVEVPEPSSLFLVGLGSVGLSIVLRRKK